jgi:hypothetical protein
MTSPAKPPRSAVPKAANKGRLKIGDDWNAITIIALSQNNPLKAIAEFVENSIDARATHISITRGKEQGQPYLRIVDDGTAWCLIRAPNCSSARCCPACAKSAARRSNGTWPQSCAIASEAPA